MINQRQSTYPSREPVQTNRATFLSTNKLSRFNGSRTAGDTQRTVAALLGVNQATISRLIQRHGGPTEIDLPTNTDA